MNTGADILAMLRSIATKVEAIVDAVSYRQPATEIIADQAHLMKALEFLISIGAVDEQYRDITRSGESHGGAVTGVDGSTHRGEG
jgi:hypothetical protein